MNISELVAGMSGQDVLVLVAKALAEQHQRAHPVRAFLPDGYDPIGKCPRLVRRETGLGVSAIKRIFKRLGLSHQVNPSNATKTHCKHGHEFTPENTRYNDLGRRGCKTCERDRSSLPDRKSKALTRMAKKRRAPEYRVIERAYWAEYRAKNSAKIIERRKSPHYRERARARYRRNHEAELARAARRRAAKRLI